MKPTPEQIAKLPKWAQEYIVSIERERDGALAMIQKFNDAQTPSPFFLDEWYCQPRITRYIQSPTNRISCNHAGVHLELYLAPAEDGQRNYGIEIQYSSLVRARLGVSAVGIVPTGTNTIALVHKENMR